MRYEVNFSCLSGANPPDINANLVKRFSKALKCVVASESTRMIGRKQHDSTAAVERDSDGDTIALTGYQAAVECGTNTRAKLAGGLKRLGE